ncbi:MAG: DUF554 domain-containing protein [Oscillospiraceae bacterium]
MLGVIVNTAAVIAGSIIGLIFKRGIPERVTRAVMIGIGLCSLYIGISGSLSGENVLIVIFAMATGAIIGTLLDLDGKLCMAGERVSKLTKNTGGAGTIAEGFVTASLLFCIGAMTIVGSLNAGLTGNNELLFTKSLLDFISSIMLAASLGIGVLCSAIFVLVFQGAIVLLAGVLEPILTTSAVNEMTCVGSIMIIGLGLNILGISKFKMADYLPALVMTPIICWVLSLF